MENQTPEPAVTPEVKTEAQPINTNQQPATPAQTEAPQGPNLHGFTEEELGKMRTFFDSQGGFEKIKSRISNPQQQTQPEQPTQPTQSVQPEAPAVSKAAQPPKGYASLQELSVERYFRDLANDPKYQNISEQIQNGDVLKEMAAMGMNPIDENYNINVNQVNQFLALKSASMPTKPASAPVTNTPTADYIEVGENIANKEQALQVMRQSMEAKSRGLPPHPAFKKAQDYLKNNWGK